MLNLSQDTFVVAATVVVITATIVIAVMRSRRQSVTTLPTVADVIRNKDEENFWNVRDAYLEAKRAGADVVSALVVEIRPMSIVERARVRNQITDPGMIDAFTKADSIVNPMHLESKR